MAEPARDPGQPVASRNARIGWRVHFSQVIFADPPYLQMQAVPVFPHGHDALVDRGIVWDVFALIESARRPGAHQVLTSECGYAPDAGLEESVLVSHPDADTVVWELDIAGLRPALDETFAPLPSGFLRLVFARDAYEADIRALVRELQHGAKAPVAVSALSPDVYGVDILRMHCPDLDRIRVEELEPGTRDLARLFELDADAPWTREAMWPAGTVVEFGFFAQRDGHGFIRVNGELAGGVWPGWYFTRWPVLAAFNAWLSFAQPAFTLKPPFSSPGGAGKNEFVLRQEADRWPCHEAGRRLAAVMQASLEEGATAPGVRVVYRECPLQVAASEPAAGGGSF